jgi:hypothetical protein
MASLVIPALILFAAGWVVLALVRANELFCLRVRGGRIHIARGRIPQQLLDDIADVVRGRGQSGGGASDLRVVIRGVVEDRRARLYVEGELSPEAQQRLRNTISAWPVAKIRAAPRPRR